MAKVDNQTAEAAAMLASPNLDPDLRLRLRAILDGIDGFAEQEAELHGQRNRIKARLVEVANLREQAYRELGELLPKRPGPRIGA